MKKLTIVFLLFCFTCNSQNNNIFICGNMYIEKDKTLHFNSGAFIGSSVYMFTYYKTENLFLSSLISVASSFLVGTAKELRDKKAKGNFSKDDLISTFSGGYGGVFTKIIQIDIQSRNKLTKEYKDKFK